MRKHLRKPKSAKQKGRVYAAVQAEKARGDQRDRVRTISRRALIAAPIVAAVGYFSVGAVQATIHEGDLTRIHDGNPSIVQIHDPQCPLCQTLQRQTRKAIKSLEDGTFTYLVANIRTQDGGAFSAKYGVPHVTLLLFDPQGEMVEIVRGPSDVETLRRVFSAHLARYTS